MHENYPDVVVKTFGPGKLIGGAGERYDRAKARKHLLPKIG